MLPSKNTRATEAAGLSRQDVVQTSDLDIRLP